jgi:hypothetical protein
VEKLAVTAVFVESRKLGLLDPFFLQYVLRNAASFPSFWSSLQWRIVLTMTWIVAFDRMRDTCGIDFWIIAFDLTRDTCGMDFWIIAFDLTGDTCGMDLFNVPSCQGFRNFVLMWEDVLP